ncbi:MAG: PIG-L family deacetylase [Oscillospiraceae bacterium]|nr:PIG-L family deacetylase [Oscillospiraceae bacterium]
MSLTRLALRFAAPVPKIESFDRFLFIGPHPDDIEIGAGATAAKLAAAGKEVFFLVCMDGRYGLDYAPPGTTPEALVERRRAEAEASARLLGAKAVQFLDLCDGGFYERDELIRGIARVIGALKPDVIFAPDPDVDSECHVDHRNVGEAARRLAFFAPFAPIMARYGSEAAPVRALAYYMTAKPNRYVKTTGWLDKQLSSIFDCHQTQFPADSGAAKSVRLYLRLRAVDFGVRSGLGLAEGFRVLGQTQMHCLPEAGSR